MPWAKSQIGLFGPDLARLRAGKKTRTGMTEEQLVKALHEGVKKGSKKVHHSPLVTAIYEELEGVQMRDVGKKPPDMAVPKERKKWYPSFNVEVENVPEFKGKGVGDTVPIVAEALIKGCRTDDDGKITDYELELRTIGVGKEVIAEEETEKEKPGKEV